MSGHDILAAFQEFGPIETINIRSNEANVHGVSQYAFVRYFDSASAELALRAKETICRGKRLPIRPRRRSSNSATKLGHEMISEPLQLSAVQPDLQPARTAQPVTIFSDTLGVANLPPDMCPQELYHIFGRFGEVTGTLIFPFGRRQRSSNFRRYVRPRTWASPNVYVPFCKKCTLLPFVLITGIRKNKRSVCAIVPLGCSFTSACTPSGLAAIDAQ